MLSCLDGVVIINGLPESRHPAYNMFCEFIEEGILTLEKGRRKAGFTCNIVILAESSKSANLGFSPSNTEHSDLNGEYEALKLDKRIASIVRPDFMISLGELDHNSAEDIIRIETMALKRDFNTLVNIGHVIDRCKEMTFSEIINAVRENFEEETAMVDEIVQFLDNQPELTAESA